MEPHHYSLSQEAMACFFLVSLFFKRKNIVKPTKHLIPECIYLLFQPILRHIKDICTLNSFTEKHIHKHIHKLSLKFRWFFINGSHKNSIRQRIKLWLLQPLKCDCVTSPTIQRWRPLFIHLKGILHRFRMKYVSRIKLLPAKKKSKRHTSPVKLATPKMYDKP